MWIYWRGWLGPNFFEPKLTRLADLLSFASLYWYSHIQNLLQRLSWWKSAGHIFNSNELHLNFFFFQKNRSLICNFLMKFLNRLLFDASVPHLESWWIAFKLWFLNIANRQNCISKLFQGNSLTFNNLEKHFLLLYSRNIVRCTSDISPKIPRHKMQNICKRAKVMNENLVRCKLWRSEVTWLFHEISKKEELDDATDDWDENEEESEFDKDCD